MRSTPTPTPTRQARVPAPIVAKQRGLATAIPTRGLSAAKKQETDNAKKEVEVHLGSQVGKRVISPASSANPLSVPANTEPTRRRTHAPISDKAYRISDRTEKYQYKAKQKREEEEKKVAKKEKKKAAKEKKTQGNARRGSKREKVSEEQVQKKRARFE